MEKLCNTPGGLRLKYDAIAFIAAAIAIPRIPGEQRLH